MRAVVPAQSGMKDSERGYKKGMQQAMKRFTNVKTDSLPW